ncbi:SAM-dependent methyltransferase [Streptomyces sp. t39]|uniref:SAM-dependent methyltransferase n=1 Tax=Streptomyces sp. t39 TaxID=1828156 RepID=UPI0011CDFED9|nr:SAM-dependent methyltransferase [Streptomyces sp. t39]TXS34872.1 S-adenosylmethionine-dependent methyltransferase [Streptomyces sp. t39]
MPHAFVPIGVVRGPRQGTRQDDWGDVECRIELSPGELEPEATVGLSDYSHVEVVFTFHLTDRVCRGTQHPRGNPDWPRVGILAQRAPNRPNHLGVTVCELLAVDGLTLTVRGLDALDGSPVLDVKPYLPRFAARGTVREPAWSAELMRDYF